MSEIPIEMQGTVREDGTLELDEKVRLPAGRVKVTVRRLAPAPTSLENILATFNRIRVNQEARGFVPPSREEIDGEINAIRDEAEEEFRAIEQLQEDAERARQQKASGTEFRE